MPAPLLCVLRLLLIVLLELCFKPRELRFLPPGSTTRIQLFAQPIQGLQPENRHDPFDGIILGAAIKAQSIHVISQTVPVEAIKRNRLVLSNIAVIGRRCFGGRCFD